MSEEQPKFKAGDVVRLKSGGPSMTVEIAWDFDCKLTWFNLTTVSSVSLPAACLELVPPNAG
jgi:uncharacterized protein YodC (DUF2158 family)